MISIIISAHNEEQNIKNLLLDLKRELIFLKEPPEILLCLSACTDGTPDIAKEIIMQEDLPIRIICTPKGKINSQLCALKSVNLNSWGYLFLDSDIRLKEKALFNIVEDAKKHPNVMMFYSVGQPLKRKEIFYNIINVRTLNPQFVIAKENVKIFHPYESNKRKKVFATGGIYFLRKGVYDVDPNSVGDDSYLTHSLYFRFGPGSIKETENSVFVYQPVRTFSSWISKWKRIWGDIGSLYILHPEFKYLKKYMQLKIDFKSLIRCKEFKLMFFFFLERTWNFLGSHLFKLFSSKNKNRYWVPLKDTKKLEP